MYVRSDLMSRIIKNYKNFRCKLGFKLHDITMCKKESVTIKIIKVLPNEKILQHSV